MVRELRIAGFKCFKDIKLELNNLTLFTGVNSAGKSSAIQAILLLLQQRQNENSSLNGKYIKLGRFQEVRNTITNSRKIDIGMTVKKSDDEFECGIEIDSEEQIIPNNFEKIKELDFVYLCAERIGVEDVYKQNLEKEYRIGIHGEFAFDYLSKERMNPIGEQKFRNMEEETGSNFGNQVDYWLNYIMGYSVTAERIPGTEIVKVSYRKNGDGSMDVKPQHVGTGISYISNIIIAALSCEKGSLFVVENPEIHLHPSAQSRLLDFFSFLASKGLQVIIETHSDHIFNGLRKNINSKRIQVEDTSVYFFKQNEELLSTPVKIQIDENGVIKNQEKGLFDQFDEDLDELLGL